jgi:hypothetical protein
MKKLLLYSAILFAFILFSCKKKEQIGPSLNDMAGPAIITANLSASNATPNFSTGGSVYFNAAFQNDANWVLTLTGNISGAVKFFKGVGKTIDASNATWDGSSGNNFSFRVEPVVAVLTFPSASNSSLATQQITINITGIKSSASQGKIVTDFSNSTKIANSYTYANINHSFFNDTTKWGSDWQPTDTSRVYPEVDGNPYLKMSGNPWDASNGPNSISPYIDMIRFWASSSDINYHKYFPLYSDPTQVYLNFYVYNTGTPDTWLTASVIEDANTFTYTIKNPRWTGWKLFSIRYSDMIASNTLSLPDPTKVSHIDFVLLSTASQTVLNQKTEIVSTAIDHIIWTFNKPYQP